MKYQLAVKQILSDALSKDILFAAFSYPGEDTIHFIAQTDPEIRFINFKNRSTETGFILAPFNKDEKCIMIQPNIVITDFNKDISAFSNIHYDKKFNAAVSNDMSQDDYYESTSKLIEALKRNEASKVVFSRTITIDSQQDNLPDVFLHLNEFQKETFSFIVNLPGAITWLGASPELLISEENGRCKSMSLAGTKSVGGHQNKWSEKEFNEQAYVTSYIEKILTDLNIEFEVSKVQEKILNSGIKHLCQDFEFNLTDKKVIWDVLASLHPTPAVCGIPVPEAKYLINKLEKHEREFYTGFLGPMNYLNKTTLFVNLRSARFHYNKACIFVGGGITSDSSPDSEWKETELKSKTIKTALESRHKMQIFGA